jgi:hypothetical protein
MLSSTELSDCERKAGSPRPLLVSVADGRTLLGAIGYTKIWALIKDKRLDVVYLDGRTLITLASIERLYQQLCQQAPGHKASAWSRQCGALASAANKGRPPGSARRKARGQRQGAA